MNTTLVTCRDVAFSYEGRTVCEQINMDIHAGDYELIIPMNPRCESLNAGIAAAICMWQMKK